MNEHMDENQVSTQPDTTPATKTVHDDWADTVWYVAIGIPGSVDWNLMGTHESRCDAADQAAHEIQEYWDVLGAKPYKIPAIPTDPDITDSPDFNPDLYDPEKQGFWDDDNLWDTLDPQQMLVYVANGGNLVGYVEMAAAHRGSELYDAVTKGE